MAQEKLVIYDIALDEIRACTQEDVEVMQAGIWAYGRLRKMFQASAERNAQAETIQQELMIEINAIKTKYHPVRNEMG